jgi:hypothetical protein
MYFHAVLLLHNMQIKASSANYNGIRQDRECYMVFLCTVGGHLLKVPANNRLLLGWCLYSNGQGRSTSASIGHKCY